MKKTVNIILQSGYWLMYLLLMLLFFLLAVLPQKGFDFQFSDFLYWLKMMVGVAVVPGITGFYSFYLVLFPRYFKKQKFPVFFLFAFLFSLAGAILGIATTAVLVSSAFLGSDDYSGVPALLAIFGFVAFVNGVLGLVIRGFISWYHELRHREILNKKNYDTEVALIKARLNPHFLFNTINNIDVLIEKDPGKASAYLNKLSDIMRFMLYETSSGKIPLERELEYIGKYLELQRIRSSNPEYIQFTTEGSFGNIMIDPMLFVPFIENAFKHGEGKKESGAIRIRFSFTRDELHFHCENKHVANGIDDKYHSGLGNELMKKRLNLLYPGAHHLSVTNENNIYTVHLMIKTDASN